MEPEQLVKITVSEPVSVYDMAKKEPCILLPAGKYTGVVIKNPFGFTEPWLVIEPERKLGLSVSSWGFWPTYVNLEEV